MKPARLQSYLSRFRFAAPLSFAAGCVSALSMAPANFFPALFFGFALFYLCLHFTDTKRKGFGIGWLFGFGYFLCSLSWIGNALLIEGNPYKWVYPLAIAGLPIVCALYTGLAGLIASKLDLSKASGLTGFIAAFFIAEFLRGHLFTGFPWNLYAYAWADTLSIVQTVTVIGTYGLTLLTIFWLCALPYALTSSKRHAIICCTIAIISFLLCFGFGQWRLGGEPPSFDQTELVVVQPNIPQEEKWDSQKNASHFGKLLRLSIPNNSKAETTYIIWPETAIKDWFIHERGALNAIRAILASYPGNAYLITGILRYKQDSETYHNSIIMIDKEGRILNEYDKHHLVPFGEYIPFQKWIPLKPVVEFSGFAAGDGAMSLPTPEGLTFSPLVCYEVLFPGQSIEPGSQPDFIVNVTNDAWYGKSAGPYQHFTKAMYRAVETGIPVVRSANTGFSGVIDPMGRVIARSPLFEDFSISTPLPKRISKN